MRGVLIIVANTTDHLPQWLRCLRHSAHCPGWSIGGAWVHFPGLASRFSVLISGRML